VSPKTPEKGKRGDGSEAAEGPNTLHRTSVWPPEPSPISNPFSPRAEFRFGEPATASRPVKAICNYIFETYGRFPGGTDAMHLMWFIKAHHIDTDFYDRFSPLAPMALSTRATWLPGIRRYGEWTPETSRSSLRLAADTDCSAIYRNGAIAGLDVLSGDQAFDCL
jgi:hypothetical protein